jgi:two-component system cell cycle response regulator
MGVNDVNTFAADVSGSNIVLIDDDEPQSKRIIERLSESFNVTLIDKPTDSKEDVPQGDFDLFIISTQLFDVDGLRVASHIKSHEIHRNIPCLMLIDEDDSDLMLKGLDMGINDYIIMPIDPNEMVARVKTQIRRKKFQDALKSNYQESMSMAITDSLTGLYNRHYLDAHIQNLVKQSFQNKKPFSMIIMDMDHFKSVNDNYGHNVGDEVLKQLANIIINTIRSTDLAARFGGEEFVVLMPETRAPDANDVAERIRSIVENTPFKVSHEIGTLNKTISLGVSYLNEEGDTTEELLKRSDAALYLAKDSGRNQFKTQEDI